MSLALLACGNVVQERLFDFEGLIERCIARIDAKINSKATHKVCSNITKSVKGLKKTKNFRKDCLTVEPLKERTISWIIKKTLQKIDIDVLG